MGFTHRMEHDHRRMHTSAEGTLTVEDIRHHLEVERHEGGLGYAELIDARGATQAESDIRELITDQWERFDFDAYAPVE